MAAIPPQEIPAVNLSSVAERALLVVNRDLDEVKVNPQNTRKHSRKQLRQIARSIKTFGFIVPILIDAHGRVLAGHGRLLGAISAGLKQIPTIMIEHLSEAQARAFMIADNRLAEIATWDDRLLAETLKELSEICLDFSLETTGFEMGEIDLRIEGLKPAVEGNSDPADELPEPAKITVSNVGDLWNLGKHRVLCGDALQEANYLLLMQGKRADMMFSDPPYNLPIDGYVAGFGRVHHPEFKMASGEMSETDFTGFLSKASALAAANSTDGALHFICMDWRHIQPLLAAVLPVYTELKALCVWAKDVGGQGSLYRSQHELIFVFKHGTGKHRNNVQLGQYGRYRTNVWQYPRVSSFGRAGEENLSGAHPCLKPVSLIADAILDCTARGDLVLDPFLGSGTTVIAAERTGRTCYGMELEPAYVDTIVRRWQAFTGSTAKHAISGRSFNDLEEATNAQ